MASKRRKRGRPPGPEKTRQVGVRLPVSLLERLDSFAAQLAKETPGISVSRTDAVRVLLHRALADHESGDENR